ncbi:four helix bundle protein [Pedobacter aquatilis]|uniref:four helix bundle protein n=1 Tax=Pedobacter aquatilis TaxID=351343 RepID=UPI0025B5C2B3|nr:four helix bundle protein [Pedobacter aquatilis]MDN3585145.1 four helix bundle protein [Pedobacter aquatilis]
MHNFRQLQIWREGMVIAKATYLLINNMPSVEKFGLISQISRCGVSVPSNIAEGSSRSSNKEFAHFLSIALGSLFELETQILLSVDLGFLTSENVESLLSEIIQLQKKISTFKKTLI